MTDIELVIKIDEKLYSDMKSLPFTTFAEDVIINGIPLPKGHGRLGDLDAIIFENADFDTYGDYCRAFDAIDQADTIIEADKAESDEEE